MSTATTNTVKTYTIDKSHSEVTFQVRHLITKVRGAFSDYSGTIDFDAANPTNSKVQLTIQVASIDTREAQRDAHLKSDDFFSAEKFPTLRFVSTKITAKGGQEYDVEGDLTIRDVTKHIVVPGDVPGCGEESVGQREYRLRGRDRPSTGRTSV
ncbi:MAG: YceI family protein [Vicinamibacterales bacterium]